MISYDTDLIYVIRHIFGEIPYELSQGLPNGLNDYRKIFDLSLKLSIEKLNLPQNAVMMVTMMGGEFWSKLNDCYDEVEKEI